MSIHQSLEVDSCVFPPFRLIAGILRFAAASTLLIAPILTAKSSPEFPGLPSACGRDDLVVTESVYAGYPSLIVPGTTILPTGVVAIADGGFPEVFNNATVDSSFGITSPIYLLELTSRGAIRRRILEMATKGTDDALIPAFPTGGSSLFMTVRTKHKRDRSNPDAWRMGNPSLVLSENSVSPVQS